MTYPYGRDIEYTFYPIADREYVSLTGVVDSPAIYVYRDQPSRDQAAVGGGSPVAAAIVAWTDTADGNGKTFTIPAIDDPNPNDSISRHVYWLAVNFRLKALEQVQTVVRALPMERIAAHHKAVRVTVEDLEAYYPTIDSVVTESAAQEAAINTAITAAKIDLEAQGYEWAELWRPDFLSTAIAHKALSTLFMGLMTEPGDRWFILSQQFSEAYKTVLNSLKLERASEQVPNPDNNPKEPVAGFVRFMR